MLQPEQPKLSEEETNARVKEIVTLFDAYLDEYRVKSARSKHALMGPVAKVLDRAKAGQWDSEPLTGYALRMHEMNPRNAGVSLEAATKLRDGVDALLRLCRDVPVTQLAGKIEQIDYSLYWQRRVKGIAWLEQQRTALIAFLNEKYAGDNRAFAEAWGLKRGKGGEPTINSQHYFGPNHRRYRDGTIQLKADMDQFYERMRAQGAAPEAAAEDDEEA
jgi:hypothetical protein